MSAGHSTTGHFIERHWGFGLVLFGLVFVTILVSYAPAIK